MPKLPVVWLPEAATEQDAILDYISQRNINAALATERRISQQIAKLADFPYLGRLGRVSGTYELVISRTPFIAAYRIAGNTVQILHVFHSRRDWP
jgi:plasmid stabilization system protein ParE